MPFITSMEKEGLEKGLVKGREEVARRMIVAGKPDQEIADLTSLSLEAIGKLRSKIKESGKKGEC